MTLHLAACMVFAMAAPGPVWATGETSPHPVMQIEQSELDVGAVMEGNDVVGTFRIKNTGNAELRILSAKPG